MTSSSREAKINELASRICAIERGSVEEVRAREGDGVKQSKEVGHDEEAERDEDAWRNKDAERGEDAKRPSMSAFAKICRLLSVKERSSTELRERLLREGFESEEVESALERAINANIVDDARFAQAFCASKRASGWGRARIASQLKAKGIDVNTIDSLLEGKEEEEWQRALVFLKAHPPRSKNLREGAYRKLMQKGYGASVSASVARTWVESLDDASSE